MLSSGPMFPYLGLWGSSLHLFAHMICFTISCVDSSRAVNMRNFCWFTCFRLRHPRWPLPNISYLQSLYWDLGDRNMFPPDWPRENRREKKGSTYSIKREKRQDEFQGCCANLQAPSSRGSFPCCPPVCGRGGFLLYSVVYYSDQPAER
jgi:hypothetical protein